MTWSSVSFANGEVLTHTKLNQLVTDVGAVLNAGITANNVASGAGITPAQLANRDFVFVLPLQWENAQVAATANGNFVDTISCIPYTFTIDYAVWHCTDVGDNNATFSLRFGTYASGAWVTTSSPLVSSAVTIGGAANSAASKVVSVGATLNGTSATPYAIALEMTAIGTNYINANTRDYLRVDLICRRNIV